MQYTGPIEDLSYFLFGSPEGVFSQRHLSRVLVWPPWACFSFSCRAAGAAVGCAVTPSLPFGDGEGEGIHPGAWTGPFSHPSVRGNISKPAARCGSSSQMWEQPLFFCSGWRVRHSFQLPCGVWREGTEEKLLGQGSQSAVWTSRRTPCVWNT